MKASKVVKYLNKRFLGKKNIKALLYLQDVIGSTLPFSHWINEEFGTKDGTLILSTITKMKEVNAGNMTPEQLVIMLENDLNDDQLNGWNGRLVEHEGCVVDAWDVQREKTIYKVKRRIKVVARTVKEREEKKIEALALFDANVEAITGKGIKPSSVTFIADPFEDDYILTNRNSAYIGFLAWNGERDIKSNWHTTIGHIKSNDCIVATLGDFAFLKDSNGVSFYIIEKDKLNVLNRNDSTNFISMDDNTSRYEDEFMDWYDDMYGDSLFASKEKLASAYNDFQKV